MTDLSWGGHQNGRIDASAMVAVRNFAPIESGANTDPGINSNLMMPEAAHQLGVWQDAYEKQFGKPLRVSEAYRGVIRQRALYQLYQSGGTLAAYPGTSNHGFGRAVDLGSPVSSFGTAEHNWCATTASSYGFQFDVHTEAWHASYYGNPTITTFATASTGTTTLLTPPKPKGDDDMYVLHNKTNNWFMLVGKQYVRHLTEADANLMAAVTSVQDEVHSLSDPQCSTVFAALNIPVQYRNPHNTKNRVWSK